MASGRKSELYEVAIHEAAHAVISVIVEEPIDFVTIVPARGYSGALHHPQSENYKAGQKLWDEATAISRKLTVGGIGADGRLIWFMRKGAKRLRNGKVRGVPAPQELLDRRDALRKQANTAWKQNKERKSQADHIRSLMVTLAGPVSDEMFFNIPFKEPRSRLLTKAEIARLGYHPANYGRMGTTVGNSGASGDFRHIRDYLKKSGFPDRQAALQHYRRKTEELVRQHRATIRRVAKALLKHKTLTGTQVETIANIDKAT